jgi:hypothetical protein
MCGAQLWREAGTVLSYTRCLATSGIVGCRSGSPEILPRVARMAGSYGVLFRAL